MMMREMCPPQRNPARWREEMHNGQGMFAFIPFRVKGGGARSVSSIFEFLGRLVSDLLAGIRSCFPCSFLTCLTSGWVSILATAVRLSIRQVHVADFDSQTKLYHLLMGSRDVSPYSSACI